MSNVELVGTVQTIDKIVEVIDVDRSDKTTRCHFETISTKLESKRKIEAKIKHTYIEY